MNTSTATVRPTASAATTPQFWEWLWRNSAELAERYGWINRALPAAALGDFVRTLAQRIASFPSAGHAVVKTRVNAIALASVEDFRRDSDAFGNGVREPQAQARIRTAMSHGFQTRDGELDLARMLGDLEH